MHNDDNNDCQYGAQCHARVCPHKHPRGHWQTESYYMNVRLAQQMQPANLAAIQEIIRIDLKQRVLRETQTHAEANTSPCTDPRKACKDIREFALCTRSWRDETHETHKTQNSASPAYTSPKPFKHIRELAVCRFQRDDNDHHHVTPPTAAAAATCAGVGGARYHTRA